MLQTQQRKRRKQKKRYYERRQKHCGKKYHRIAVDEYIQPKHEGAVSISEFVLVMLSMLVLDLVIRTISVLRTHLLIAAGNKMIINLRNTLFDKVQRLSIAKISKRTAGDLMRRVTGDVWVLQNFIINYLPGASYQLCGSERKEIIA